MMQVRRNDFDVTNRIQTTDPAAVQREISRLFRLLYPGAAHGAMDQAFTDIGRLYRGDFPGYLACDTAYHDVQHVMDVTLAMGPATGLGDRPVFERGRGGPRTR